MKKIILLALTVLTLVTITGCGNKDSEQGTITKEPVAYSDTFLLVSNKYETIDDLASKKIAYSTKLDTEVMEYVINEIAKVISIDDLTLVDFDDYVALADLRNEVDAYIVPEDVHNSIIPDFRFDYKTSEIKVIEKYNMPFYEEQVLDSSITNSKLYTEPFAVMIDGIDGAADPDANAYLRNDVNHLMIVDPVRNHITMISFPRDSLVYNNKTGYSDKLTHHGLNGVENIKRSVGGVLDADIPYYMQVSFSSFVQMINLFGGVWVDVPLDTYMDMDSERDVRIKFNIPKGVNLLYGEEALALSRNRKYANIYNSDQGRLRNQALIITSLMKKITNHPRILEVAHANWWFKYVTYNNFEDSDLNVLIAIAKKFADEGYTVDNYFLDGYGDMAGDTYVLRLYDDSVAVAKGKYQLAMTGTVDSTNPYYDEILTGWINKGTGTYEVGYIGEEYDLNEIYGLKETAGEVQKDETADAATETASE